MPRLSAEQLQEKHARRLGESTQDVIRGVNAVTESPMDKAADRLDIAAANYAEAVSSGRMAARLHSVPLSDWKAKTVAKASRIGPGILEAKVKMVKFFGNLNAALDEVLGEVNAMPDRTPSEKDQKMLRYSQLMRAKKGTLTG